MAEHYYSLTDIVKLCDNLVAAMPTSFYSGIMTVRTGLANIPAADVRPVVLCRDCKHWQETRNIPNCGSCYCDALLRWSNFYCAAGEKREVEHD